MKRKYVKQDPTTVAFMRHVREEEGIRYIDIAKMFDVPFNTVAAICSYRAWSGTPKKNVRYLFNRWGTDENRDQRNI